MVALKGINVGAGQLEPNFDPEVSHYDVVVQDPTVKALKFIPELQLEQYDLMNTPMITLDDEVINYTPTNAINFSVPLNESAKAFDATVELRVSDPSAQKALGFTLGNSIVYSIHISQPPDLSTGLCPANVTAVTASGTLLDISPPFNASACLLKYTIHVPDEDDDVTLHFSCAEAATRLDFNGVDKEVNSTEVVTFEKGNAVEHVIAQCNFQDPKWFDGAKIGKTAVLEFQRDIKLDDFDLNLLITPDEGECNKTGSVFHCAAWAKVATFVVTCNSDKVEMFLEKGGESSHVFNSLPFMVDVPDEPVQYLLVAQAGHSKVEYSINFGIGAKPKPKVPEKKRKAKITASCSTMRCPKGWHLTAQSFDTRCEGETCSILLDTVTCCAFIAKCDTFSCPEGLTLKKDAAVRACIGDNFCTIDEDLENCCSGTVSHSGQFAEIRTASNETLLVVMSPGPKADPCVYHESRFLCTSSEDQVDLSVSYVVLPEGQKPDSKLDVTTSGSEFKVGIVDLTGIASSELAVAINRDGHSPEKLVILVSKKRTLGSVESRRLAGGPSALFSYV